MIYLKPETQLETHDVTNQPPPFENVNIFTADTALHEAVVREGAGSHVERLAAFGARCGSAEVLDLAQQANRNPPQLKTFDRYGQRIDEVEFHPAYHRLMQIGIEGGVSSAAWTASEGGHVLHTALEFLMTQGESSVCCPMTMTYAVLPALSHQPDVADVWRPRILASQYDPSSQPAAQKAGVTLGMAMTEKQGGSDVRANTTRATALGKSGPGQMYRLEGHKWFCSAPMSDAFLTLAYAPGGMSCFLVSRWKEDGERNPIHLMRLKDKLGDRANASSEIEYHGAHAVLIGEEGRGVRTIIEMVHHTRLDCILAPAAFMRQALANAMWHAAHRSAFQKRLIDQPLMRQVLTDMAIESEAATALTFRIARSFDESPTSELAALFSRIATPVGKYWINKRVVNFVYEAMEAHGGAGYIEEGVMPRLFRQSPLNSIWEGSGNVICLDVLRAFAREPQSVMALVAELDEARGGHAALDRAIDDVKDRLTPARANEMTARRVVETMALALQGAVLMKSAPSAVSDAFCATRLGDRPGVAFGALDVAVDSDAILKRAMPQVG
ncbi:MAG TPA: acyl-CoA dehydrogenase family protein [Rhizomicrobium sp.]|nr:acyl-CoA dehydrogenase family protein [Rhizomicrobium sp.]